MRRHSLMLVFICAFAFSQQPAAAVIGFLEDHSTSDDGIHGPALRVAFTRKGSDWSPAVADPGDHAGMNRSAIPGISKPQIWGLLDQGKPCGAIATEGWSGSDLYCTNGLLHVTRSASFRGNRSALYAGWDGGDRHRPMLALLGPGDAQRTAWHQVPPVLRDLPKIWPLFRQAVPAVPRCDDEEERIHPETATTVEDIGITAAYANDGGQRLVCAALKPDRVGDCGLPDRSVSDFWFLLSADGKVFQLHMPAGDDAITLTPLEFLRLDGEEIEVFFCSGYNRDGYLLYYDGFQKDAEMFWSYH